MLRPAIQVLSYGELTPDQLRWLLGTLRLEETPRTEGLGAAGSITHNSFTDDTGTRLVLDLARVGESSWTLTLFYDGEPPSTDIVEDHRVRLRDVIERLDLTLIEITPAATADEVYVASPPPPEFAESGIGYSWEFPYTELDQMWQHLGLRRNAPQEVKAVKLREVMSYPVWSVAPANLRRQAEEFLRDI